MGSAMDGYRPWETKTQYVEREDIMTYGGGMKSSKTKYRAELLPPKATLEVIKVLTEGLERYSRDNWKQGTVEEHLARATTHLLMHNSGDTSEEHLSHAATRIIMALELYIEQQ